MQFHPFIHGDFLLHARAARRLLSGPLIQTSNRVRPLPISMTAEQIIRIIASIAVAAVFLSPTAPVLAAEPAAPAFHPGKVRIVLVGDSTVTDNAGWGKGFANCLKDTAECINLAKGGRSSKSFIGEGSWRKALDLKPDYVLIQFGHNDQPGHGDRETDPQTTYKQSMTQYVEEARAAGIKPVLVTSLSRREWKGERIVSRLQPWVDVVKTTAAEKSVPLIDLHARSIERYEQMGPEKVLEISPGKNADPTSDNADTTATSKKPLDGTHLNEKGGEIFGAIVAEEIKRAVPELAPHIK